MAKFFLLSITIILSLPSLFVNSFTTPSISTLNSKNMKTTTTAVSSSSSSCVAQEARSLNLFSTTPLIHSITLSKLCYPHPVYLKLDLLQPSGSFKDRGSKFMHSLLCLDVFYNYYCCFLYLSMLDH